MTGFLTLEMRRCVRDVRYLVIAVAMPIGLYLLFTGLFSAHGQRAQGLPQPTELMVAMIAYGAMWAVFSATGPRIAQERAIGWARQLRVTPLTPASALSGKLITALAAALPAMLLVALTAVISHHIRLGPAQWLALLATMWAAVLPLALLGLAIGYLAGDDIAFPLPHPALQQRGRTGLADRRRPGLRPHRRASAGSMDGGQRTSRHTRLPPPRHPARQLTPPSPTPARQVVWTVPALRRSDKPGSTEHVNQGPGS